LTSSIIGHGGASGYRPENSLGAFDLAMAHGAHGVSLSVAPTSDGRLAVVAAVDLSESTDVRKRVEFASRFNAKRVHSQLVRGWFSMDFTSAELGQLNYGEQRPRMRKASADFAASAPERITMLAETVEYLMASHRGITIWIDFPLPTQCAEWGFNYADLVAKEFADFSRKVDVTNIVFVSPEKTLIRELKARDLGPRIFYRTEPYGYANDESSSSKSAPLTYATEQTPAGLQDLAQICDGIVVDILQVFSQTGADKTAFEILWQNTDLVTFAHAAGLEIAGAVLRAENSFRPQYLRSGVDPAGLTKWDDFFELAVARNFDAIITDHPDLVAQVNS
jgi:glycerophosphoryl diester phosphodiesterase